jgi:hypothetical protein
MHKVSFHKHDVVGAQKTREMMENLGFKPNNTEYVSSLVRWHQFRFYPETKENTIVKWIEKVKPGYVYDLIRLRLADRSGNLKNSNKVLLNKELADLIEKLEVLIPKTVSYIYINKYDLMELGIEKKDQNYVIGCLKSKVFSDKLNNSRTDLLAEVIRMRNKQIEHNTTKISDKLST